MPILFQKYYPARKIVFFLGETLLIALSLLIADWVMMGTGLFMLDLSSNLIKAGFVTFVFQLCLYFFDQYDLSNEISLPNTLTRMTQAFGVGCIILGGIYYTLPFLIISSKTFWVGYLDICISIFIWRGIYYLILRKRLFVQNVVVLGTGAMADAVSREVEGVKDSVYKIIGFVGTDQPSFNPHGAPVRKVLADYKGLVETYQLERIIVALDDARGSTPIKDLLWFKLRGIIIEQGITFFERITGKILVEKMPPSWIIFSEGFALSRWKVHIKRMMDLLISSFLLLLSFPVVVVTAVLIKIDSQGPVFYFQERVGVRNRTFNLMKFRSMRTDAEKDGAVWARKNDDRVTRVGRVIRKWRIDEIPQLVNVLSGDMSLVGPRPERRIFVEKLEAKIPYYGIRHELKPGVTGWAQVSYPYGASEEDALKKLEYDLYYMKNMSIAFDLLVIFKTVKTVLFQQGAR